MRLTELLRDIRPAPALDPDILGATADSRRVGPGFIFAALSGSRDDGRRYVADAIGRGAVAVLSADALDLPDGVAAIRHPNPRKLLSLIAARLEPGQPATVAAITGTNGKTSVAVFTRQIWSALGHRAGSLGTLGVEAPGYASDLAHTTPDPERLHRELAALSRAGVTHLAMEASSHGLDQERLAGIDIAAGAFTNLSRDHFDYHGTEDAYFAAKMKLFGDTMPEGRVAVLNADDRRYAQAQQIARGRGHRIFDFGRAGETLKIEALAPHPGGLTLDARLFGRRHRIDLPLVGAFQAANVLCALGLVVGCDPAESEAATAVLGGLAGVPGRMEKVAETANGAAVYVDFAHSPDALDTVLSAIRPHVAGRLGVVFGCGGDRDRGKRPMMGAIAEARADLVWVTDDNPRTEDPAAIRAEIMPACPRGVEVGDRAEAIALAVAALAPGDVLVIAGKGHERGQIVGTAVRPFDDAEVARAAVGGRG